MTDVAVTQAAFLVALAEHGIPPDVQELLVNGDGRGTVAPGALAKALSALQPRPASTVRAEALEEALRGLLSAQVVQPYRGWNITALNKATDQARISVDH